MVEPGLRRRSEVRYALLICHDETVVVGTTPARVAGFTAFQEEMTERGILRDAARLRPSSGASTVRVRNRRLVIADGPFAETKEQIAGFYVVECADLDEAIEVAAKVPAARCGTVEIRPVWEMP
jgi:hypothetical protein